MRIRFFLLFLALCAGTSIYAATNPNVLLICVDDLKPALGAFGDKIAKSPHIDRLASRGIIFERAYCNQAVCAPSRNALLTGRRSTSLGIYDLGTNFRIADPDTVTLPQYFMRHGYRTEALGKIFHVGHGNHEDPTSWSVPHWPIPIVAYAGSNRSNDLTREEALFSNVPWEKAQKLRRGPAYEAADVPDNGYPDGQLSEEVIQRLQRLKKNPDQPFFLAVGFVKPHLPFCAPKKYWDLYDPSEFKLAELQQPPEGAPPYAPQFGGELRQYDGIPEKGPVPPDIQRKLIHGYYASMSYTDAQIGKVIAELDRLKLTENTLIILWGDHGWHLGDHGIWCKHTNYEQAARIPILVSAPGLRSGKRATTLVETVDIYPTLCELAHLPKPTNIQPLDGTSFASALKSEGAGKPAIFHSYPRNRKGDGQIIGRAVRTERYRLVEWKKPGAAPDTADLELYDYQTDPEETRNLASDYPEVVAKLRSILSAQPEALPQIRKTPATSPEPRRP